jgi:plasmid stabilization system protein ParE
MPRLLVREQADKDVDQIVEAIADDNLSAAMQFQDRVRETYDRIATWPQIGARIRARDEALRDMRSYPHPRLPQLPRVLSSARRWRRNRSRHSRRP